MTDFNRNAPRFKVGDKISWPIVVGRTPSTDHGVIKEAIWGRYMHEPLYRTKYDSLIPESLIIAPKWGYDRYCVDVVTRSTSPHPQEFGVTLILHFREGHGNMEGEVKRLISDILEEHCEHN